MRRLYLVRPVKPTPLPHEQHGAKVIALRARREARTDLVRVRRSDGPDAA
jgi:hypothetical protein